MTNSNGSAAASAHDPQGLSPALDRLTSRLMATPSLPRGEAVEAEAKIEQQRRHQHWKDLVDKFGARYAKASIANFVVTSPTQTAVIESLEAYLTDFAANAAQGRGLLLYGPAGTGKDHLAVAAIRHAVHLHGTQCAWVDGQQLYAAMRDRISTESSEQDWLRQYVAPGVLLISDPLPQVGSITDFQQSTLWRIIDKRYRAMRPTWVTLNVADAAEAAKRLGTQLTDRLTDGAACLHCNWPSHRKPFAVVK